MFSWDVFFVFQVALAFVLGCAYGAPSNYAVAAPAVAAVAAPAVAAAYAAAPAAAVPAYGPEHYTAGAIVQHPVNHVAPPAPAPYTTVAQAEGVTTVHQPAPVVTKQVHFGQTNYVSGSATRILKPATPHLPIQVPTVLKGTQAVNAPIVKTQTEIHNVQEPVLVNKPYDAPYDAPFTTHKVVEVPTPVHVDAPYNVPVPVAVQGETIIKRTQAAPVVTHSHHVQAAPAVAAVHAAPAVAAVHAAPAVAGYTYAAAPAVAGHAIAAAPAVIA